MPLVWIKQIFLMYITQLIYSRIWLFETLYLKSCNHFLWNTEAKSLPHLAHETCITKSNLNKFTKGWFGCNIDNTWIDALHSIALYPAFVQWERNSYLVHRERTATLIFTFASKQCNDCPVAKHLKQRLSLPEHKPWWRLRWRLQAHQGWACGFLAS